MTAARGTYVSPLVAPGLHEDVEEVPVPLGVAFLPKPFGLEALLHLVASRLPA